MKNIETSTNASKNIISIDDKINEYKQKIEKLKAEMSEYKDFINELKEEKYKLQGKTEICPKCWGGGKEVIGHSWNDGLIVSEFCAACNGTGRLTKEEYNYIQKEGKL